MKAVATLACAPFTEQSGVDSITSIVQAVDARCRVSQEAFERLEPCAVKIARTVLRGGDGSNVVSLPDLDGVSHL